LPADTLVEHKVEQTAISGNPLIRSMVLPAGLLPRKRRRP